MDNTEFRRTPDVPRPAVPAKQKRRYELMMLMTVGCAAFDTLLLILMPVTNPLGSTGQTIGAYILAAFFWAVLVAEIVLSVICSAMRRRFGGRRGLPGIILFFRNREALIADIALFVSAIYVAVIVWLKVMSQWMIILGAAALFLSLNLHAVFNGANFTLYKSFIRGKKELGKK